MGADLCPSAQMPYRIVVNREPRESNAECVSLAPEVFGLDEEELCGVMDPDGARIKRILAVSLSAAIP